MARPDSDDRDRFEQLSRLLEPSRAGDGAARDVSVTLDVVSRRPAAAGDDDPMVEHERVELPRSAMTALLAISRALAQGQALRVVPVGAELTTQDAADLLGVSRPHLIKLIDQGALPHHMVGTHRRLMSDDVLAYRDERDRTRRVNVRRAQLLAAELQAGD